MTLFDYESSLVEIQFPLVAGITADNFLKVKETLTRIGVPAISKDNPGERVLWQSCHILHKRHKYYIVSFKEMFLLDGKTERTNLTTEDLSRRNAIVKLLSQWGLITIVKPEQILTPPPASVDMLKIIPFKDKATWDLRAKYEIGRSRGRS